MQNYHHGNCSRVLTAMLFAVCGVQNPAVQQTIVSLDNRTDVADSAAIVAIRSLEMFKRHEVKIYAVDTEQQPGKLVSVQVEDRSGFDTLGSIGWQMGDEPLPDFVPTVLGIAGSQDGGSYLSFRAGMARRYSVDEKDFDDVLLHRAFTIARSFFEKRRIGPRRFYYLVVSLEGKQRPLALVTMTYDTSGRMTIDSVIEGTSLRTTFDSDGGNGFRRLEHDLANRASAGDQGHDESLRLIWPEAEEPER